MENTKTIEGYIVDRLNLLESKVTSLEDTNAQLEEQLNEADNIACDRLEIIKGLVEAFHITEHKQYGGGIGIQAEKYFPEDDDSARLIFGALVRLGILPEHKEPEQEDESNG